MGICPDFFETSKSKTEATVMQHPCSSKEFLTLIVFNYKYPPPPPQKKKKNHASPHWSRWTLHPNRSCMKCLFLKTIENVLTKKTEQRSEPLYIYTIPL